MRITHPAQERAQESSKVPATTDEWDGDQALTNLAGARGVDCLLADGGVPALRAIVAFDGIDRTAAFLANEWCTGEAEARTAIQRLLGETMVSNGITAQRTDLEAMVERELVVGTATITREDMARLTVIAEQKENDVDREMLNNANIDYLQGRMLRRTMSCEDTPYGMTLRIRGDEPTDPDELSLVRNSRALFSDAFQALTTFARNLGVKRIRFDIDGDVPAGFDDQDWI